MIFLPHIISLSPPLEAIIHLQKKKDRCAPTGWLIRVGCWCLVDVVHPAGVYGGFLEGERRGRYTQCVCCCVCYCVCVCQAVGSMPYSLILLDAFHWPSSPLTPPSIPPSFLSLLSLSLYSSSPLFLFRERAFCNAKLLHVIWWRKETKENGIMKNTIHLVWTYAAAGNEIKQTHVRHLFFLFGHCQELCARKKRSKQTQEASAWRARAGWWWSQRRGLLLLPPRSNGSTRRQKQLFGHQL